jgi:putative DNA primase/helicase
LDSRQRNDNALAERFIDTHGNELRYVAKWRKWLVWDGQRFRTDDDGSYALKLGRKFAKGLWTDFQAIACSKNVSRRACESAMSFVRTTNKSGGIRSFIELAKADDQVHIDIEAMNSNTTFLNLKICTSDFETGVFREHRRDDLITQIANVSFDPSKDCPKWQDALSLICGRDTELQRYVQQLLGYSIAGDSGEHILPIIVGGGHNGKSFVWNAIVDLLGDYAEVANESLLLGVKDAHPTEKASLYQKRFVPISEPEQFSRMRESRVKELTGDRYITARRMREDFWRFERTHTFWLSTNHLPRVSGTDDGIWRRIKIIPFAVDLRKVVKPVPNYHQVLIEAEGPGILNWLLDGYADYRKNGFVEPQAVKRLGQDFRAEQDHIGQFISECCVQTSEAKTQASRLFDAYAEWGGQWSSRAFGDAMTSRFLKKQIDYDGKRNVNVYHGIGLISKDV